jgi:putative transposase
VLGEHGIKIAPSTFYEALSRRRSKRVLRDCELVAVMEAERARQKLIARFGARKMWLHLRGKGHDVARCTIERLYREQGWVGALLSAYDLMCRTGYDLTCRSSAS